MMRILVPVKRVPDYAQKISLLADGSAINTQGVKWIANPFDEIAVEEALRIKESRGEGETEILVVSIGSEEATEQLRTALAMGADRAIVITTTDYLDSDCIGRILHAVAVRENVSLIILGKQAIDSDSGQAGQILAAAWSAAQATFASKIDLSSVSSDGKGEAVVTREVDGGLETIRVTLPAVLSTDLRLNEPRYPSLPGIVKAKKKPLEVLTLNDLKISVQAKVLVKKLSFPPARTAGGKVSSVDELVQKLQTEAKVL